MIACTSNIVTDRKRQGLIVLSVAFAAFMCTLDNLIVNISLPTIAQHFNVSTSIVSRIILVYLLFLTSTVLLFGKLADRHGHAKVFCWGYGLFSFSSLLCGLSPSINILILSRCLQGIGASILFAIGPAVIARYLPCELRGWGYGLITTAASVGLSLGAPLGGLITSYLSWHWIFLINVPVGIVALIVLKRVFPAEPRKEPTGEGFDYAGAILSVIWLVALMYFLNMGQEHGWLSPVIFISLALAVSFLVAFIIHEKRFHDPLISFELLGDGSFFFANAANLCAFALMAGNSFIMSFYLIQFKELKPDEAGFIMMSYSIVVMFVGPWAGRMCGRIPPRRLCIIGMMSATAACIFFAVFLKQAGVYPAIGFLMWLGLSYGFFISPNNTQIMNLAPEHHQGSASGVLKTLTNLGAMFGVCLFETIYTLSYPNNMVSTCTHIAKAQVSAAPMLSGFRSAYICGAVICGLALLFSFLARREKARENPQA